MKTNARTLLFFAVFLAALCTTSVAQPITIFTIGDSTMANKPTADDNPERGWGQMLGQFFTDDITIENHAVNGRSSKSFIDEGRWDVVKSRIKPGDYVFIQFGHNDEKEDERRHTDVGTTFDENLRRYVRETQEAGGIPVLLNSIVRRNFGENAHAVAEDDLHGNGTSQVEEGDKLIDTHGAYRDAPRSVAKEMGIVFIDANAITHQLVEGLGPEASKELYLWIAPDTLTCCPAGKQDNTHLSIHGATVVTGLLVEAITDAIPQLKSSLRVGN